MKTLEDLKAVCEAAMTGDERYLVSEEVFINTLNPQLVSALIDEVMAWRNEAQVHWQIRRDYPELDYGPDVAHEHLKSSLKLQKARERLDALIGSEP